MKNNRLAVISLLLVLVLTLSACSVSLPGSANAIIGGLVGHSAVAANTVVPDLAPITSTRAVVATDVVVTDLESTLQTIYERVNPSVVNISVAQKLDPRMLNMPEIPFPPGRPFQMEPGSPDEEQAPTAPQYRYALGSGFIWDTEGYIVTNNHVVQGADRIKVTFSDGVSVSATLVGTDPDTDLAVIKVDSSLSEIKPITVADSTQLKVGRFTVAIGNPFGLEGTMTFGIVSALGRTLPATGTSSDTTMPNAPAYTIPDIIQTDAPVNPGNSGGVLLDLNGNLIGVPSAIESSTNSSAGIGFAIPSVIVAKVVPALIADGSYDQPWVGISGTTLSPEVAEAMNLDKTQRGAMVVDVTKDSPADKAGLRGSSKQVEIDGQTVRMGGDVIIAIDDQPVTRFENLTTYLARSTEVGQTISLTVLRDGREMMLSLTLAARPGSQAVMAREETEKTTETPAWLGIYGQTLVPDLAQAMDLDADQAGVLVQNVVNNSPAEAAGLEGSYKAVTIQGQRVMIGGDVIVALDGDLIADMETLAKLVQGKRPGEEITLATLRDGEEMKV